MNEESLLKRDEQHPIKSVDIRACVLMAKLNTHTTAQLEIRKTDGLYLLLNTQNL